MQVFTSKFWLPLFIVITVQGYDDEECTQKTSHLPTVRLKKHLLCDYDRTIRPVVNHTNATTVTVKMILKYFNYDMHMMQMTVHSWLGLIWKDEHLQWKPADFDSLEQTHIGSDEIWNPDVSIYNSNDQGGSQSVLSSVNCLVIHTGTVVCLMPTRYDARCVPNIAKFPFDQQNCSIRLGSWVHSGEELDFKISKPPVTMNDYLPNGDWNLNTVSAYIHAGHFNCCPDNSYPSVNYNFILERHSRTDVALITAPAIVMIIITLATVFMDPLASERFSVACCNFIIHNIYIQLIYVIVPSGGDNPALIVFFLRDSLILCTVSLILTVVLKNLIKTTRPCPSWISTPTSIVISIPYAQTLLVHNASRKGVAVLRADEDTTNILESNTDLSSNEDWKLFTNLLDRLSVIVYVIVYFVMFLSLVP